jgi:hypothetical protein
MLDQHAGAQIAHMGRPDLCVEESLLRNYPDSLTPLSINPLLN